MVASQLPSLIAAWRKLDVNQLVKDFAMATGSSGLLDTVARAGHSTAEDMCGNPGQIAIINMTGYEAFERAAAELIASDADPIWILYYECPHPEAVEVILEEASMVMKEMVREEQGSGWFDWMDFDPDESAI